MLAGKARLRTISGTTGEAAIDIWMVDFMALRWRNSFGEPNVDGRRSAGSPGHRRLISAADRGRFGWRRLRDPAATAWTSIYRNHRPAAHHCRWR